MRRDGRARVKADSELCPVFVSDSRSRSTSLRCRPRNPVPSFATAVSKKRILTKMIGRDRLKRRAAALHTSETSLLDGPVQQQRHDHACPSTANRLLQGRSAGTCLQLMSLHLVQPLTHAAAQGLQPQRGLTAQLCNQPVFVVDVFTRHRRRLADVACLLPQEDGLWLLGKAETVHQEDLQDVGFQFRPVNVKAKSVLFEKVPELQGQATFCCPIWWLKQPMWPLVIRPTPACPCLSNSCTVKQSWRLCLQQRRST